MDWLRDHAFLATWLSPCLAIIIAIAKNKGRLADIDLSELTIHLILLGSFAIWMTPAFDHTARTGANFLTVLLLVYVMYTQPKK